MEFNNRNFWDSASTFGDSDHVIDDSSCRWDSEDRPTFPLSLSSMVSPKLPKRQKTNESVKDEMIEMMIAEDNSGTNTATGREPSRSFSSSQSSETTLSPIDSGGVVAHRREATQDDATQSVAAARRVVPRRQFGSMVLDHGEQNGSTRNLLISMRMQSLSRLSGCQAEHTPTILTTSTTTSSKNSCQVSEGRQGRPFLS